MSGWYQHEALDLQVVQRDDELLDLLAERQQVDTDDPALLMLQALTEDVDAGLAVAVERTPPAPSVGRRRWTARTTAVAVVLGATLSVSGVAAAVSGDPFAPYRGIWSSLGDEGLPANAARVAHLNKALSTARVALNRGEVGGVQERLDAARDELAALDLTAGQRRAFERRLSALEEALARATARPAGREGGPTDRTSGGSRRPDGKPSTEQPGPGPAEPSGRGGSSDNPPGVQRDAPKPDKPTPDKPTPDKPTADKPAPDRPAADRPAPDKPAAGPSVEPSPEAKPERDAKVDRTRTAKPERTGTQGTSGESETAQAPAQEAAPTSTVSEEPAGGSAGGRGPGQAASRR